MELEKAVVGDWSCDGHGMADTYSIKVPCKFDTKEAYKVGTEAVGHDMTKQCAEYGDCNFHKTVYDAIAETAAKHDVQMWDMEFYDEDGEGWIQSYATSNDFFNLWLVVVNIGKQIMQPGSPPIEEHKTAYSKSHKIGGYGLYGD